MARAALILLALCTLSLAADGEWVKGVQYTTDWKKAIKEAHATGKILFVYNGWELEKV